MRRSPANVWPRIQPPACSTTQRPTQKETTSRTFPGQERNLPISVVQKPGHHQLGRGSDTSVEFKFCVWACCDKDMFLFAMPFVSSLLTHSASQPCHRLSTPFLDSGVDCSDTLRMQFRPVLIDPTLPLLLSSSSLLIVESIYMLVFHVSQGNVFA